MLAHGLVSRGLCREQSRRVQASPTAWGRGPAKPGLEGFWSQDCIQLLTASLVGVVTRPQLRWDNHFSPLLGKQGNISL